MIGGFEIGFTIQVCYVSCNTLARSIYAVEGMQDFVITKLANC